MAKKGNMVVQNIYMFDGRRTSITMSEIQLKAAKELAEENGKSLNTYIVEKIYDKKNENKTYGASQAVRDGIMKDLFYGNTRMERIDTIVRQKNTLFHYRRLMANMKRSIRLAMEYGPDMQHHFSRVWKEIEANGIKDCFDSGKEYEKYIYGKEA